jgi:hypothetical protein
MKYVGILLLFIALPAPLPGNPAKTEEELLAIRVAALLDGESAKDRAWGAYLAGKHGLRAAADRLVGLLEECAGDEGVEASELRRGILDALIRLKVPVDLEILAPLVSTYPSELLVMLAARGKEAEPLLLHLLDRPEKNILAGGTGRAVRMLLAEWRSRHVAADLLDGLTVRARIDVFPKDFLGGVGGGGGSGGGGAGSASGTGVSCSTSSGRIC